MATRTPTGAGSRSFGVNCRQRWAPRKSSLQARLPGDAQPKSCSAVPISCPPQIPRGADRLDAGRSTSDASLRTALS